ncbi:MAG: zinc ribbon domain-containing protein [Anaerolineales bacterium]|nr:zinc ribbon domain-containing protein [Anaerolineales bacterium]
MDVGSILLLLALVVVVGAFIASPLRGGRKRSLQPEINIELSELLAERERVLEALAELDFDNEMGKVPETLYPVQREALVKRGAAVLRLLDEHTLEIKDERAEILKIEYDRSDSIEAKIAARRMVKPSDFARKDTKDNFCANCGAKLRLDDKFCPGCGQKL